MLKQEIRSFSSQYKNGAPMFPGKYLLTWAQIAPGIWSMIGMEPVTDEILRRAQ